MATSKSRRDFLADSTAGLGSVWLAAHWPAILEAEEYAQKAATAPQPVQFAFFTEAQAADIDAMASQIIPTDATPGAHEAHIVNFIDRALVTFERDRRPIYIQGLKDLQAQTKQMFPSAARFSALTSPQQIQVLTAIEKTPFFRPCATTPSSACSPPEHGGNYNKVGWTDRRLTTTR